MDRVATGAAGPRNPDTPRQAPPESVKWAARIMYGGAAATLVGIFANATTLGDIKRQRPIMAAALQTSTARQAIAEFIVGGLIGAAIWAFMAISCQKGSRWARITGTALFAVYTVYATEIVVGLDKVSPPGAVQAYTIVLWVCGLAATVLLWQGTASAHFSASDRGAQGAPQDAADGTAQDAAHGRHRARGGNEKLRVEGQLDDANASHDWNFTTALSAPHVPAGRGARSSPGSRSGPQIRR